MPPVDKIMGELAALSERLARIETTVEILAKDLDKVKTRSAAISLSLIGCLAGLAVNLIAR